MFPVAPHITAINFVFTFHISCTYIARFTNFSSSSLVTFLFPEIVISINEFIPFLLSQIVVSGVLFGMVLSVLHY